MPDIFLSYSRSDQAMARRFADVLQREGFSVWWDQTLRSGDNYDQVTERALQSARAVVVLWSRTAVDSRWVRSEATSADRRDRLVPVMIEPCERPIMFELKHTADLSHWTGDAGDPAWRSFVEDVRRFIDEGTAPDAPVAARAYNVPSPPESPGRPRRHKAVAVIAGVLLLLGAGVAWILLRQSGPVQQAARTADAGIRPRICVLPLTGGSTDAASFADGLHEMILTLLANRGPGMDVISSTTMNTFRGKSLPVTEFAKPPVSCTHVLEGAIFREDQLVRLIVQLIETKTDRHIWAQTYDRELVKAMTLQSEVADEVAGQLSARLASAPAVATPTANPQAFELFVRAQGEMQVSGRPVEESLKIALNLLDQAIGLDPQFGAAYLVRTNFGPVERRIADLERARSLLGNTPQVRAKAASLAFTRSGYDATPALRELEGAGSEAESDPAFLDAKGQFLLYSGRTYEALGFLQRQVGLDPGNLNLLFLYAGALEAARKPAEALRIYDRVASAGPVAAMFAEPRRGLLLLSVTGRTQALRAALDKHGAGLPEFLRLAYEFECMRFEQRYADLAELLRRSSLEAIGWPLLFQTYSLHRSLASGFTALLTGDRAAAAEAGQLLLKAPVLATYQARGEGERAMRENNSAVGEMFVGNFRQARLLIESREKARAEPGEHAGIWMNPMMQLTDRIYGAIVYAWIGEEEKAVDYLEDLAVRDAGLGPADIARDPLFTLPLARNPRYQALVRKLEAQMAANPLE